MPLQLATMIRMMTLILSLTLLLTTSVHAYHRGERRRVTSSKRSTVGVRGRRSLQMDTEPSDGMEDTVKPAPTENPTTAMIATSATPSVAPSPAPEPSAFPSRQLDPGAAYSVNLLEFTVWTNGTDKDSTTTMFRKLLTKMFKKEFDSFYSVDLQLLTLQISGRHRVLLDELRYAGTATFDGVVSKLDVLLLQNKTLQDLSSIQEYSPRVQAISIAAIESSIDDMSSPPPSPSTQSTGSSINSTVLLAAAIAMVGIVLAVVAYFGYRFYRHVPPPPPLSPDGEEEDLDGKRKKKTKNSTSIPRESHAESDRSDDVSRSMFSYDARNTESDECSVSGLSSSYSEAADMDNIQVYLALRAREKGGGSTVDGLSIAGSEESDLDNTQLYLARQRKEEENHDDDDAEEVVSHDESSTTDSEPGINITTQRYLQQRQKQKELQQKQQQQKALMASKIPVVLYESDADCSYDYVGRKGMESDDDDLYMTDNEPVEVGVGGSAAYMTGYYGKMGRENSQEDDHDDGQQVERPRGDVLMLPRTANQLNIQRVPSYGDGADDDDDKDDYGDDEEEYAVSPRRLKKRTPVKDVDKENASAVVRSARRKTKQSTTRNPGGLVV